MKSCMPFAVVANENALRIQMGTVIPPYRSTCAETRFVA
jgi:hypothetical protein